jgi:hypothetical protein
MTIFRILLFLLLASLTAYTGLVVAAHGFGLLPIFFSDIFKLNWPGQFNLDFLFMLFLSATWTAWRNRFSRSGIVLAFFALIGGSLFLSVYLLVLSWQTKGDTKQILLGNAR